MALTSTHICQQDDVTQFRKALVVKLFGHMSLKPTTWCHTLKNFIVVILPFFWISYHEI